MRHQIGGGCPSCCPGLIHEFGATRSPEIIRGCADRILDEYDHVPVRSHILTLANKRARDCLRHEHCEMLDSSASGLTVTQLEQLPDVLPTVDPQLDRWSTQNYNATR